MRALNKARQDDGGSSRRSDPRRIRLAHRCVECRRRRSLFRYRGVVKADSDHTLCFQCYRGLRDRLRGRRLTSGHLAHDKARAMAAPGAVG